MYQVFSWIQEHYTVSCESMLSIWENDWQGQKNFFFFFLIRNSIHLVYFKGAILFIYQWKKLKIIPLPKSANGKQIPLKVTVTYRVHPGKMGEAASTHHHEFHQRLDPLKGGEKRQLSRRSMLLNEAFLYSFLRAPGGDIFAKLDLGSGMWK